MEIFSKLKLNTHVVGIKSQEEEGSIYDVILPGEDCGSILTSHYHCETEGGCVPSIFFCLGDFGSCYSFFSLEGGEQIDLMTSGRTYLESKSDIILCSSNETGSIKLSALGCSGSINLSASGCNGSVNLSASGCCGCVNISATTICAESKYVYLNGTCGLCISSSAYFCAESKYFCVKGTCGISLEGQGDIGGVTISSSGDDGKVEIFTSGSNGDIDIFASGENGEVNLYSLGENGCVNLSASGSTGCINLSASGRTGDINLYTCGACGNINISALGNCGCVNIFSSSYFNAESKYFCLNGTCGISIEGEGNTGRVCIYASGENGEVDITSFGRIYVCGSCLFFNESGSTQCLVTTEEFDLIDTVCSTDGGYYYEKTISTNKSSYPQVSIYNNSGHNVYMSYTYTKSSKTIKFKYEDLTDSPFTASLVFP